MDTKARRLAAEVVEQFRDGMITNIEFENLWLQHNRRDRGLSAVETMLWRFYDDFHEHKLVAEHAPTAERRDIFDRCALFPRTELDQGWADDSLIGSVAPLWGDGIISLWLSDAG